MPDVNDVDDAYLAAKAEVDQMWDEVIGEWFKPYSEMAITMLMNNLPDEVKAKLKEMAPEAFKNVEEIVKRAGGK